MLESQLGSGLSVETPRSSSESVGGTSAKEWLSAADLFAGAGDPWLGDSTLSAVDEQDFQQSLGSIDPRPASASSWYENRRQELRQRTSDNDAQELTPDADVQEHPSRSCESLGHDHNCHDHHVPLTRRDKYFVVAGNLVFGLMSMWAGKDNTLSVTTDGAHSTSETAVYNVQIDNLSRRLSPEKRHRNREIANWILSLGGMFGAGWAAKDFVQGAEHTADTMDVVASAGSLSVNAVLGTRLLKNSSVRRFEDLRTLSKDEKQLWAHFWFVDNPSALLALSGALTQNSSSQIEQILAAASGVFAAVHFLPGAVKKYIDNSEHVNKAKSTLSRFSRSVESFFKSESSDIEEHWMRSRVAPAAATVGGVLLAGVSYYAQRYAGVDTMEIAQNLNGLRPNLPSVNLTQAIRAAELAHPQLDLGVVEVPTPALEITPEAFLVDAAPHGASGVQEAVEVVTTIPAFNSVTGEGTLWHTMEGIFQSNGVTLPTVTEMNQGIDALVADNPTITHRDEIAEGMTLTINGPSVLQVIELVKS